MALVRSRALRRSHSTPPSIQVSLSALGGLVKEERRIGERLRMLVVEVELILLFFRSVLVAMIFWTYGLTVRTDPGGVPAGWVRSCASCFDIRSQQLSTIPSSV